MRKRMGDVKSAASILNDVIAKVRQMQHSQAVGTTYLMLATLKDTAVLLRTAFQCASDWLVAMLPWDVMGGASLGTSCKA